MSICSFTDQDTLETSVAGDSEGQLPQVLESVRHG